MSQPKIIVAFTAKGMGIGKDGKIPWNIREDLARFAMVTWGEAVIMGTKTWLSLPRRPLADRWNVVVTTQWPNVRKEWNDNTLIIHESELDTVHSLCKANTFWVIGGAKLYSRYMGIADEIHATVIDKDFDCDVHFPLMGFNEYVIQSYSEAKLSATENCNYRYVMYKKTDSIEEKEDVYLSHVRRILEQGDKRTDRTQTGTISVFGTQLRFDISRCFPLITTKHVPFKAVIKELLFFLCGQTNSKVLEDQNVHIWKANTTRDFLDKRGLTNYREGDMGPMYGFNWRYFGAEYKGCDATYAGQGYDQLTHLIEGLKNDPFSRRHMLTTFNPAEVDKSVLAPCHGIVAQFYVHDATCDKKKRLSCHVYIRSSDTFLGLPFNIASYAALTYLIAKICGMHPHHLIISIGDAHIYKNHVEQLHEQLRRHPYPFPCLEVDDAVRNKSFDEISVEDFTLVNYMHHPAIKGVMAV